MIAPVQLISEQVALTLDANSRQGNEVQDWVTQFTIDTGDFKGHVVGYMRYLPSDDADTFEDAHRWQVITHLPAKPYMRTQPGTCHKGLYSSFDRALNAVMACAYDYIANH